MIKDSKRIQVGKIGNYPVFYLVDKRVVFCKNCVLSIDELRKFFKSPIERTTLGNLTITKMGQSVDLGCLSTSLTNITQINKTILTCKK